MIAWKMLGSKEIKKVEIHGQYEMVFTQEEQSGGNSQISNEECKILHLCSECGKYDTTF